MKKRRHQLITLLFPRFCVGCSTYGNYLCTLCKKQLKPHPPCCPFCHRITSYGQTCPDCHSTHRAVDGMMIAFQYTTTIKKLILKLKYYHTYDIADFLGQRLSLLIQTNPLFSKAKDHQLLFISYIPTHRRRRRMTKGYNQSKLLAETVARELNVACLSLRTKTRYTPSQTMLDRKQRLTNLRQSFVCIEQTLPEGATVIVIDDITTTGATIDEVATLLKIKQPSLSIWGVVVGRHGR